MDPMDIRSEIAQSQGRPLLHSSSSALGDQNNPQHDDIGASVIQPVTAVAVVQSSSFHSSSPTRTTRSNIVNRVVLNPPPVSEFNPNAAIITMPVPVSYVPNPKTSVDIPKANPKTNPKANPKAHVPKPNPKSVVPKDKSKSKAVVVKDKGTGDAVKDKAANVVSAKAKADVVKDKETGDAVKDKATDLVSAKATGVVVKDKASDVVSAKAKADVLKDKVIGDVVSAHVQKTNLKAVDVLKAADAVNPKTMENVEKPNPKPDVPKRNTKGDVVKSLISVAAEKPKPKSAEVSKSKVKASDLSKAKQKPKAKVDISKRKRKLSDKDDSGEPVKLSKKSKGKVIKEKRVLYSSSSSLSTDEVHSDSSDERGIVMKKVKSNKGLKRKKVSDEVTVNSNTLLKKLFLSDDADVDSLKLMLKKLKGVINEVSDSEDEGIVRKSKRKVKKPKGKMKKEDTDFEGEDEANVRKPKILGKKNMLLSREDQEQLGGVWYD